MHASPPSKPASERIVSVDALRGFDMFWIVGGRDVFLTLIALLGVVLPAAWLARVNQWLPDWETFKYEMDHASWEGFTAWDLIMPLFLFVVGVAMPLAFAKRMEQGQGKLSLYVRLIRRVVVLWVLGLIAQGNLLDFDKWVPQVVQEGGEPGSVAQFHLHLFSNTLQSIAVGYLIASIVLLHLPKIAQVVVAVLLLAGFWALLAFVTVPGAGAPAVPPDPNVADAGAVPPGFQPKQNLASHVDEVVLGRFRDGTTYTWVLSGMGFAATVLLGVFAGQVLRSGEIGIVKTFWLIVLGVVCLALGLVWHGDFTVFGRDVTLPGGWWTCPIVKHLWTSSMVLYAAGWCYLLLAAFYLVIDVLRLRWLACGCTAIGANAIFAYILTRDIGPNESMIIPFRQIGDTLFGGLAKYLGTLGEAWRAWPKVGEFILPLAAFGVLWILLHYMRRKGTFLRV